MNLRGPLRHVRRKIDTYGVKQGIHAWLGEAYLKQIATQDWETESIFSRDDWDILLVLDACRYDLFTEVEAEYDFITHTEPRFSPASCTWEWLPTLLRDTPPERLDEVAYVTGNPQSQHYVDDEFGYMDEVWQYGWDDDVGTVPPRPVTDRAISYWREDDHLDKMIVHYMQPHVPFIPSADSPVLTRDTFRPNDIAVSDDWILLGRGDREFGAVWHDYRENLRLVLDDVAVLLENADADTVVLTSDHGNAVGEYGIYGHPDVPLEALRKVPWALATATDERTHEPREYSRESAKSVKSKLEDLGYW